VKPGDLVFDIGAHLGNRTEAFLDLGAKVIAVEPQPHCVNYLRKKFSGNSGFTLVEKLIGSEDEIKDFYISADSPTISTARGDDWRTEINRYGNIPAHWNSKISVPVITLDVLIKSYGLPSFCKVDVEGFEWEVVQGLSQQLPALSLEYLAFDLERMIQSMERLISLGMSICNFSKGESQRWYWREWKETREVIDLLNQGKFAERFGDFYFRSR
jgi:FkbM family methyltransferase